MSEAVLLIGTSKGVAIARSKGSRTRWELEPLQLLMSSVYGLGIDRRRDTPRLFAGATSEHWGPSLFHSDDLGRSWSEPEAAPVAFPADSGTALIRVWQVEPGPEALPDVVYAGVEPHALFRSRDGGETFDLVEGLFNHPHRPEWEPGGGGACLHTIVPHPDDPERILVALSAGGVYRTADGGASWEPANRGIQAHWLPEEQRFPEFGQCVHKVSTHRSHPERLLAQNHFGVYRSDNYGDTWQAIETGLPANFGFPVLVHPQQPDTAYLFPLQADTERLPPDRRCRVYRTRDLGGSWEPLTQGLPQSGYHAIVLRDALCTDFGDPTGLYFGTRDGEVYQSLDDGDSWQQVAGHLPDVLAVRAAVLG
ncbi:MAG: WD40/YVTN/BNR-like repeat-containing protein [Candidatus Dormibacteria bacterium]